MKQTTGDYGLPKKVLFCTKCVISNQRPSSTVEFKSKKNEHLEILEIGSFYGNASAALFFYFKNF